MLLETKSFELAVTQSTFSTVAQAAVSTRYQLQYTLCDYVIVLVDHVINLWEVDVEIAFTQPVPSLLPFVPILKPSYKLFMLPFQNTASNPHATASDSHPKTLISNPPLTQILALYLRVALPKDSQENQSNKEKA